MGSNISEELKAKLIKIIKKYKKYKSVVRRLIQLVVKSDKERLTGAEIRELNRLIRKFEEVNAIENALFENFRAFQNKFNKKIPWYENQINAEREKFVLHLASKLTYLENEKNQPQKDWKELLKVNLDSKL